MPPQKLEIGVVEERAGVGGPLAAVDSASAELQAKVGQNTLSCVRIRAWPLGTTGKEKPIT